MSNDQFVEVSGNEYQEFLKWLDENKDGFRYMPNTMACKTSIYYVEDVEHKNIIANRYLPQYDDPEKYDIRKEEYEEFKK